MAENVKVKLMKPIAILNSYFNSGEDKRPTSAFAGEIKALTKAEQVELATLAAVEMSTPEKTVTVDTR